VTVHSNKGVIAVEGGQHLRGCNVEVPADLSSASFVLLAALLAENADILIRNVGINPTRTGVIDILRGMGADIALENSRQLGEEPVADIRVRSSELHGGRVDPSLVSLAIDEFPVLFVAAASAQGETVFSGLEELRVKESDRIATMATGMRNLGITVNETADGAVVQGGRFTGGVVQSCGDHRVAMSLAVAGTVATDEVRVEDVAAVDTSFPGFRELMRSLGAEIKLLCES
ncbi:MAG: bifunctional prephenate dehydrogenase/3-phosphoshikimate 1-carboxyvinyltransferase, partial [Gammaproteobacteria bacterium]|nr:bifunctional prephenate dehydrogenase/3-phosphoshikimate 1-carboxyvinyltransferase [Gammaproteobacteria bacterium]